MSSSTQQKQNKKTDSSNAGKSRVSLDGARLDLALKASDMGLHPQHYKRAQPTKAGTYLLSSTLIRGAFPDTSGALSQQITMTLGNIINSSLVTAYTTLFEEVRLLKVVCTVVNTGAMQFGGMQILYIDRDPADAIVANIGAASTEEENVYGSFHDKLRLVWVPRDPLEREYQLVSSFSAPASFNILAAATSSTDGFSAYLHFDVLAEWRGRDF